VLGLRLVAAVEPGSVVTAVTAALAVDSKTTAAWLLAEVDDHALPPGHDQRYARLACGILERLHGCLEVMRVDYRDLADAKTAGDCLG
jgi:hypothetical protein